MLLSLVVAFSHKFVPFLFVPWTLYLATGWYFALIVTGYFAAQQTRSDFPLAIRRTSPWCTRLAFSMLPRPIWFPSILFVNRKMGSYTFSLRPEDARAASFCRWRSVEHVDPRSDVLKHPVETIEKPLSGVSAAGSDLPMPASVHPFQIQNLKQNTQIDPFPFDY